MAIRAKDLAVHLGLAGTLACLGFLAFKGRSGIDADVLSSLRRQNDDLDARQALGVELRSDISTRRPWVSKESVDEASARLAPLLVDETEARALAGSLRAVCATYAKRPLGPEAVVEREPRAVGDGAPPLRFKLPVTVELDLEWADVGPFLGELQDRAPGLLAFESVALERGVFPFVHVKLSLATLFAERRP